MEMIIYYSISITELVDMVRKDKHKHKTIEIMPGTRKGIVIQSKLRFKYANWDIQGDIRLEDSKGNYIYIPHDITSVKVCNLEDRTVFNIKVASNNDTYIITCK